MSEKKLAKEEIYTLFFRIFASDCVQTFLKNTKLYDLFTRSAADVLRKEGC